MKYVLSFNDMKKLAAPSLNGWKEKLDEDSWIRITGHQNGLHPEAVRKILRRAGVSYKFRVVAHINLKGGIGKTTSAISLATRAAQYGFRTCLIDLDPQASASISLDCGVGEHDPIFYDIWQRPADLLPAALKDVQDNLSVLPSSLENSLLDTALLNPSSQKNAIKDSAKVLRQQGFDLVIIDCPPSLGAGTISAICAASSVVIPVSNDALSFKGLELTLGEVENICRAFSLKRPSINVLFARYDRREGITGEAEKRLQKEYGKFLLPFYIRTSTLFSKALEQKESIFANHHKTKPKEDYDRFARHILGIPDHLSSKSSGK